MSLDVDALASLYILEVPMLTGQWNIVHFPWDKCWEITWPEATSSAA
jgi:hypothetical protein